MRKYALGVQSTPDVEKHGVMKTVNQKQTAESPQRSGMTSAGGSGHTGEVGSQTENSRMAVLVPQAAYLSGALPGYNIK